MQIPPNAERLPPPTRFIGPVERHFIIVGHVIYAVLAGIIILITNSLLAALSNAKEFLGTLEEIPSGVAKQIDEYNAAFMSKNREPASQEELDAKETHE